MKRSRNTDPEPALEKPSGGPHSPDSIEPGVYDGVVVKSTGSHYEVQVGNAVVQATMRGKFRLSRQGETNPLAVGDRVTILVERDAATVENIATRTNQLSRRAAGRRVGLEQILVANVDFAWVVQSTILPRFNPGFVDRFLVMAQHEGIPAGVIINKVDLITETTSDEIDFWRKLYESLGYPVLYTSAVSGAGEGRLRDLLVGQTTVFSGPSGVGKSSLINRVDPSLGVRTGDVSTKTRKGRHVTTNATLYTLSMGGRIVDTPGLREFGIVDIKPAELGHYFVEFKPFLPQCRYPTCTHDHEPDCAVVDAMERGVIPDGRWASYLNILASIQQGEADTGR